MSVISMAVLLARTWLLLLALSIISPPFIFARNPGPMKSSTSRRAGGVLTKNGEPVRISRFGSPPLIDGRLDEDVWNQATVFKDFYQIEPGDNIKPTHATEVRVGFDSKFLYLAFRAEDDPEKIRATVAKRDAISDEDFVGVYLDTFNDQRKAYELMFNPLGVQADGIFTEGIGDDFSVDIVMQSKGRIDKSGYIVEVAIPFKSLRYEAGKGRLWGIHFIRRIRRSNNERISWMPISRDKSGWLNQAGHITGLEGLSTERSLEIIPSLTISETGKRVGSHLQTIIPGNSSPKESSLFLNKPLAFDPGVTAKFGITPTVTLDFALNPDFAQVEADQTVSTANQRFPIFFEEKRPFFLEGAEVFRTPLQVLNTRAVIDPDAAIKLTGKRGRNTFGVLLASDNAPGNFSDEERSDPVTLPLISRFLGKNAYLGAVRLKRDVSQDSSVGIIATSYNFIEKHNQLIGLDGRFRLDTKSFLSFQAVGTSSRNFFSGPEGDRIYRTGNGIGYYWEYDRKGRYWSFNLSGQGVTKDYRADVGFTRRLNTNREVALIRYNSAPAPKARLISWGIENRNLINFDWQGRTQRWDHYSDLILNLPRQSFLNLYYYFGYERVFEEEFGPRRTVTRRGAFIGDDPERSAYYKGFEVTAGTTPSKKYSLFLDVGYTFGQMDFDLGGGARFPRVSPAALVDASAPFDPGPGGNLHANWVFTYRPTDDLRLSIDYTRDSLVRYDTGRTAFDSTILVLRATYQFTRFTFMRARVDSDSIESTIRGQFLLGWTPNPGTSFYVGYNDDLNHNGFNPFTGQSEPGFRRNGRTFFVKMSYLFRHSF